MPFDVTGPVREGDLAVGDGQTIHWTESGTATGKPVVLLHGGPGSGSSPRHRRLFDPTAYRIIQFDQRNCGQSTPSGGELMVDLSANTTSHLIGDIEQLRALLDIERWMVWGGSWGSTLGLAYAQAHPSSVSELVVTLVGSTNAGTVDWITRSMGRVFPEQWQRFRDHVPADQRDGNLARAYHDLLMDPDPAVHEPAAIAWCDWEDAHVSLATGYSPSLRYEDPRFRLCFARLVTHYWANAAFMGENQLLDNARRLDGIPTFLAHGRMDISSPIDFPVALAEAIPHAELFIAEGDGHGGTAIDEWTIALSNRLATTG